MTTKLLKNATAVMILTFTSFGYSQSGKWEQKTDFAGGAREGVIGFSIDNKGYIGSGRTMDGVEKSDFWEYDPQNDTWTQKADLGNTTRFRGVGFSIGNKGYAGIGYSQMAAKSDFWEYDPSTNKWTQKAYFVGTGKTSAVAFSIGNVGYVGTGSPTGPIGNETKEFWKYDPTANKWSQLNDFPGMARDRAVAFSIGNKGYLGTGYAFKNNISYELGDFWEYTPETDTWTEKSGGDFLARNNAIGFATQTKGYIGLGYINKTDMWQYTPETNKWLKVTDFPAEGRIFPTAICINNVGYFGFGYNVGGNGAYAYNDWWSYTQGTLGEQKLERENKLGIFPNPASDFIQVNTDENAQISIYNLNGQELISTKDTKIDIQSLNSGIYFVVSKNNKGVSTAKFKKK